MRLQRTATYIKDLNWVAVLVEFLIVVMGVFLGLQLGNWNDARVAARVAAELEVTLERDFAELETSLSERIDAIVADEERVSELLEIVRADVAPTDPNDPAMLSRLDAAWTLPRLPSPPASYVEIVESGKLSIFSDPELRRALGGYGQAVALHNDALPPAIEAITARESLIVQSLRLKNDLEVGRSGGVGIEGYDWDVLKDADADVQMVLVWQTTGEMLARQQLAEVEAVLAILRKEPR